MAMYFQGWGALMGNCASRLGAITMKMMMRTNSTSMSGVTLIAGLLAAKLVFFLFKGATSGV